MHDCVCEIQDHQYTSLSVHILNVFTGAPSQPTNVSTTSTNTTVTVTWGQPVSDGGRPHDIFYRVRLHALLSSEDPVEQSMIIYSEDLQYNANNGCIVTVLVKHCICVSFTCRYI